MNQHYYFSKEGGLRKIDKMPPEGAKMQLTELREFIHNLLQQPPIPCERFTEDGVYPEDRIEWKVCKCNRPGYGGWKCVESCGKEKVAVLKEDKDFKGYIGKAAATIGIANSLFHASQPAPSADSPEPVAAMTPQSIVDENFKGLDDAIGDSDLSDWYKRLIVTCLEGYGKHARGQQGEVVAFAEWATEEGYRWLPVSKMWIDERTLKYTTYTSRDLYALFSSRPGNLQQGEVKDWKEAGLRIMKELYMRHRYFLRDLDVSNEDKRLFLTELGISSAHFEKH